MKYLVLILRGRGRGSFFSIHGGMSSSKPLVDLTKVWTGWPIDSSGSKRRATVSPATGSYKGRNRMIEIKVVLHDFVSSVLNIFLFKLSILLLLGLYKIEIII